MIAQRRFIILYERYGKPCEGCNMTNGSILRILVVVLAVSFYGATGAMLPQAKLAIIGGDEVFLGILFYQYPHEINAVDNDGNTGLRLAVRAGFGKMVWMLLKRGAEINLELDVAACVAGRAEHPEREEAYLQIAEWLQAHAIYLQVPEEQRQHLTLFKKFCGRCWACFCLDRCFHGALG
jgi:hypothetical protein